MIVIKQPIAPFDVDGTLIVNTEETDAGPLVQVKDTVTKGHVTVRAHLGMIRLLREAHQRGDLVYVWSRGGWEWARNVLMALELTHLVHSVSDKPMAYYDDVAVDEWLPYRVYLNPSIKYKREIK